MCADFIFSFSFSFTFIFVSLIHGCIDNFVFIVIFMIYDQNGISNTQIELKSKCSLELT